MKSLLYAALMLLGAPINARAQEAATFPFVLPWDDSRNTITDVGALNPAPAGKNGTIRALNGHFYDESGRRVRFLGTNFTFSACFPDKADAEKIAARLHKYGVNIVRLHHMDMFPAPQGIWDPKFKDKQHLDPDQLDRLDYLVFQLKQHGIYVNINLHVSRAFTEADGFPETAKLPDMDKAVDFFEPRMIALQKQYAHDLLTHTNPYTKSRYVDDPCVAVIEINNENTLLGAAWGETLDNLPPSYQAELTRQWNAWLKQRYATTDGLKRAWASADKPLGPNLLTNEDFTRGAERWTLELNTAPATAKMEIPADVAPPEGVGGKVLRVHVTTLGAQNWHIQLHQTGLDLTNGEPYTVSFFARADKERPITVYTGVDQADWHNIGLNERLQLTPEWQKFTLAFTATRAVEDHSRLSFTLGDALGTVDLAEVTLQPGVENPFPEGASLEKGSVPLGRPIATPAGQDWIAFLLDTERSYMTALRDYVKKDLGAHANVTGSQASYGGPGGALREADSDFVDMHAYWQHPEFPHKPWDPADWRIRNTPMVRDADGGTLPELAAYRVAGKPFTVSEYNEPAPNDYQEECVPILAAFAALQDWDGLYLFDYNGDRSAWKTDHIKGFFSVDTNPAKMAFLPAAALIFLRFDMPLAHEELRMRLPAESMAGLLAKNGPEIQAEWEAANIHPLDALAHRFSVSFAPRPKPAETPPAEKPREETPGKPAAKGPISWEGAGTDRALFTADSPSSKVMVGYLGGQKVQLGSLTVQMAATPRNFAALTLSAMDGRSVWQSHSLLLTALGSVGNTGMQWNADRTSVGDHWGSGPTLVEGVPATILIETAAKTATVYALDGTGKRLGTVDSKLANGFLSFAIGPANKTIWYEIEGR